jgi:hypothetical protein
MSIGRRATHVLSTVLIVAFAGLTAGWTAAGRDGDHCRRQQHPCAPEASLDCRCHISPISADAARLPDSAPPQTTPCQASPMDIVSIQPSTQTRWIAATSPHLRRHLDLGLLHRTFLI